MTELLVGTKKGLFVLEGDGDGVRGHRARVRGPERRVRDARPAQRAGTSRPSRPRSTARRSSSPTIPPASGSRRTASTLPEGDEKPLERLWMIVPGEDDGQLYAGGAPGALFESRDGGATWELNRGFWEQPTRPDWSPGAGGLCLHSIATWPGDPSTLALAISAVGVWLSDDGGADVAPREQRDRPRLHAGGGARRTRSRSASTTCTALPRRPERLFMQFHGGVYRSDDAGESWIDIADGLPSDFGFPIVVDPADPDSAYVIPRRRRGPHDARRRACASTRRATPAPRGVARRRPPRPRVPHDPAPGVRQRGRGRGPGALLRRDVGRRVRLRRRRHELAAGGRSPATRVFGADRVGVESAARGAWLSHAPCVFLGLLDRRRDPADLARRELLLDLLRRGDVLLVRLRAEGAEADALLVDPEHDVLATDECPVL